MKNNSDKQDPKYLFTNISFVMVVGLSLLVVVFLVFISIQSKIQTNRIEPQSKESSKSLLDSSTLNEYIIHLNAANAAVDAGEYEEAIESYNEAIKISANEEAAYIGLANAYRYLGDLEKSRQILEEAYKKLGSDSLKSYLHDLS